MPQMIGAFFISRVEGLFASPALQYQSGVCATEAEAVAHHIVQRDVLAGLGQDRHVSDDWVDFINVG